MREPNYKNIDFMALRDLFGGATSTLATQLYALNSLRQNPISGDVFQDMMYYPDYIIKAGQVHSAEGMSYQVGLLSNDLLGTGCELRSYGSYGHVEQKYGRFTQLRGGIQRSLLALELIPVHILDRIYEVLHPDPNDHIPWLGYINISEQQVFEVNEVIYIPPVMLWDPRSWWTLFHEIAHILIDRNAELVPYDLTSKWENLTLRGSGAWSATVMESVAEILGYDLGFFNDFGLFMRVLWKYLIQTKESEGKHLNWEHYALRTFCVKLFGDFRDGSIRNLDRLQKSETTIYEMLLGHANDVEKIIGDLSRSKKFFATDNIKSVQHLIPILRRVHDTLERYSAEYGLSLRSPETWLSDENTLEVIASIRAREPYWDKIRHPEAILYMLTRDFQGKAKLEEEDISVTLAAILSFWNAHLIALD